MSCRVGAISPHGRWNVCVFGLHLSTSVVRRDLSRLNLDLAPPSGTGPPSTSRHKVRRPVARNLKKYKPSCSYNLKRTSKALSTKDEMHEEWTHLPNQRWSSHKS